MASQESAGTLLAYFVLADISGYTGFLAKNELEHAQQILGELTELLIEKLSAPFRFVELEGDAVFVFAPDVAVEDSERLVEIMEACYAAFRIRLEQMVRGTTCQCSACRGIPKLDLKIVGHFGRYVTQRTPTGKKLVGPDVILVHRLLKNAVVERTGIRAYALLTNAFIGKAVFAEKGLGLPHYDEEIAELGLVEGRVLDLAASVERYRSAARRFLKPADADIQFAVDLPAPRSSAWAYIVDARRRLRWQQDTTSVENHPSADGRFGAGWESHCDHGSYRMNHRVTDVQPFDYITMETNATGHSIVKPPPCDVTFAFEELDEARCRLHWRIRAKDRGIATRLKLTVARAFIMREWQRHFATLDRLLRDDEARAAEAAEI